MTINGKLILKVILYVTIGLLLFFGKKVFADDAKRLSHEYNLTYADLLAKKINKIHTGIPVVLFLKDGSEVSGIYKGYSKYDDSVWIKEDGAWLQSGYGINELQDVVLMDREPI